MISINKSFFHSHKINSKQKWRQRRNVIGWCIEIKHNTHNTLFGRWRQRKQHTNDLWGANDSFSFILKSTEFIKGTGTTSLSDALKSNRTLAQLYLGCEDKRNNTQMTSVIIFSFSVLLENSSQHDWRQRSIITGSIIENEHITDSTLFVQSAQNHRQIKPEAFCPLHLNFINRLLCWRRRSNSIKWSIEDKHNTHQSESGMWTHKHAHTKRKRLEWQNSSQIEMNSELYQSCRKTIASRCVEDKHNTHWTLHWWLSLIKHKTTTFISFFM